MKKSELLLVAILCLVLILTSLPVSGCRTEEESTPPMLSLELAQLIPLNEASTHLDSDMDGIKDDIEMALGTDPYNRDTDYDGLTDYYEVFSQAAIVGATRPVDDDEDGIIAALDADDHSDLLGNPLGNDLDGDGIPNLMELYGYTYDPKTFELKNWYVEDKNGNPVDGPYFDSNGNSIMYFKTDPTKASTDGDPYDDYMELIGISVNGMSMDSSVTLPGNRPVVPAYPDLAWSMTDYEVTVISTITTSEGHKTENTWKNETINERTTEDKWNVKESLDIEISAKKQGLKSSIVANQGGQVKTKHLVTKSSSGLQQDEWYQVISTDTHKAAELKIALDIKNVGSATAYNILPTVQMMIGDTKVGIDFTPTENQNIGALSPGQEYAGAYTLGGSSSNTVTVSIDQLRALQLGAPLLLNVPQWTGEVMKLDGTQWNPVGQWQPYQININAVSAKLSVDTGDGEAQSYLVYATGESGSGPEIKFRDILTWTVGYQETSDGVKIKGKLISEYRIGFDSDSLERIKENIGDEENLLDLVIYAGSNITLKASTNPQPTIKWANYNPVTRIAQVYVIDDYEIAQVNLETTTSSFPMTYNQDSGIGIYVTNALPDSFSFTGTETVSVTNDRQNTSTLKLEKTNISVPWAMFRNNAQHTGLSLFVGIDSVTPQQTWRYYLNTKTFVYSQTPSPVIGYDGTIYIGLEDRSFYLISPDGKLQRKYNMWAEHEPYYEKWNSPAIDAEGRIFATNWAGVFYRIWPHPQYPREEGGSFTAWPLKALGRETLSPLTIGSDGTIYVACEDGNVYAMDSSGNIKWKFKPGGKLRPAPAVDPQGNIYVGSIDGYLYSFKANSLNWKTYLGPKYLSVEVLTSPAIGADGTIYVVPNSGTLYAIQPLNGAIAWSLELKHISLSSPAIGPDGTIYIGDTNGYLWAINPTGTEKWKVKIGGTIGSSPAIDSAGTIYVGSDDYSVYAINPDGSVKWSYKTGGKIRSSPVIGPDGTIYIVSNDGYLYALK